MPNLKVIDRGREYLHQIEGDSVTIGRGPGNTIPLEDAKASKDHCRIERVGDRWKLVDLESKNGTRVNSDYCNKAWLNHGDVVRIGAAELRFGLEGAQRAPRRAGVPAPATRAQRAQMATAQGDEWEDEPPPRRYAPQSSDVALKWGLIVAGCVVMLGVGFWVMGRTAKDTHNLELLKQADELVTQDRWEDAIRHLRENGDPGGNAYYWVQQRLKELEEGYPAHVQAKLDREAREIVTSLGLKVKAYHKGKKRTTSPEEILQLVELLKTKYAASEHTANARKEYEVWFAGKVPQRAIDLLGSKTELERDWDEAVQRAREYEKNWQFREAMETLERFVSTREPILEPEKLDRYRDLRDEQFRRIDKLAESIYYGRKNVVEGLLRKKRYDEAITIYRKVIDTFGIDSYIRLAQAEIARIHELKVKEPAPSGG